MYDASTLFAPDGPLASAIPGFCARPQQIEMAQKIAEAIRANRVLVAEAGTGTGKTFAYLVPALMSGGKVIVSTGTKTLQDQLFNRDLPTVRAALKVPVSIALLKGRANYVCHYHLERNERDGRFQTPQDAADLRAISRFARITHTGDKAECTDVREDSAAWIAATSTRDNCLGQECPQVKECFVMQARRTAMEADVVVVNHHLFFADVMLRDEGMGELLPACNTVIFDEAHQLPETASLFFGETVSTSQVLELARDTRSEGLAGARDCIALIDETRVVEKAARDLRLVFGMETSRLAVAQAKEKEGFDAAVAAMADALEDLETVLDTQAERSEGLANCLRRVQEMRERLGRWTSPDEKDLIRWVEVFSQSLALNATPLHVSDVFRRQLENQPRAWVFASATLAVGNDFGHYCRELGLAWMDPPPETAVWGSPFDYAQQALLYAPQGMPEPNSPNFTETVARTALPLIRAARGRTFVLCTSLRAMRRVHELIVEGLAQAGETLPVLLQGEGSRTELLDRFRKLGNAVLVASQSFWEGVDVPGDALSLVVIDKLPFAPPDDPVLAARVEHMQKQGLSPFIHHQLPRAVINMKQGAGRLIRTERDRGVLCICDPRMIEKSYGKVVWRSLPPMRRTRVESEAVAFLETLPPPRSAD
ncbi:ATP-dependent DNA helicase [Azoarcus communis]|uniref:DNA 5'-3' helicase n=1 Tax=Parazoarcus communis SWub3 = DSM 12120 TaxID=1121029 RepID=A0A323UW63_9RHOO|nr:ATP-dependent DNA helicase [Parazoarcus communis]NMG49478.1 ATP-dependent DNA helicase [Parazoarcus communis]NMG70781.1 ATP-dependent DNA helicase [Parazoarcus communis SWub3 = DSM 12120]PZA16461.1 ATP-dependent DNA helicase [Azoarcus communis] [Parazoarcus communis SWub3 = DSM 12120]